MSRESFNQRKSPASPAEHEDSVLVPSREESIEKFHERVRNIYEANQIPDIEVNADATLLEQPEPFNSGIGHAVPVRMYNYNPEMDQDQRFFPPLHPQPINSRIDSTERMFNSDMGQRLRFLPPNQPEPINSGIGRVVPKRMYNSEMGQHQQFLPHIISYSQSYISSTL
ncbi:hypothetical protein Aperf_G00000050111 [Anoplocephala perfoliata]